MSFFGGDVQQGPAGPDRNKARIRFPVANFPGAVWAANWPLLIMANKQKTKQKKQTKFPATFSGQIFRPTLPANCAGQ